ncbi:MULTISPECIES: hemerythrin domain-containing protein [unclassified Mesorhizobium]|uniref:hemerythrin domain-containing protein n=1 Tax=unclassified Mesorhizobium TaxID=325217 RepID=UPI001CCCE948|nr:MULTISPECIES: hemerythrin domain-containing protein [unclassified Mesorhizobium]MBZ9681290.1 hemerythrin domain-containing protein [Mesorhizobium sp. CO1-1-2]MBZ9927864.1 hemerythrin domain-containing protein [Mesorhizobium sp. BR1-1-4]
MAEVTNSSLLERLGLPDDLRWLADKYPRENWQAHANIHGMANMWLQRHDMFRELGGMLTGGIGNYREGRLTAPDFARWFAPRLNHFLGHLDGHHNVEGYQYFPASTKAEPRLKRGFEILDADHHTIHVGLERNAEAANAFIRTLQESEDKQRFAADAYADENNRLIAMLTRHLADEEDLIIPLILDRGDQALGID